MTSEEIIPAHIPCRIPELINTLFLALSFSGLCYYCYFLLAPWIWSQNIPFDIRDVTPWIRSSAMEHDGVEIYALYLMSFVNVAGAFSISRFAESITGRIAKWIFPVLCTTGAVVYCVTVGFIPPMSTFSHTPLWVVLRQSPLLLLLVFSLIALLIYLQRHYQRLALAGVALLLLPACFLAISDISWPDYTYVFAPALRLIDGAALSDIYFQYDLLPSLLAAVWMKLGLNLNNFRILGQISYFFAIMSVFILSGKLFKEKKLTVFLLVALVLVRMYASPFDTTQVFQVTPLRLDLWLPLLLVVYRWGPFHWSAGLACGLLLLLLKNFGIIYSLAYLQLLLTLCAIECFDNGKGAPFLCSLTSFIKRCAVPVAIMAVAFTASYLLFHNAEFGDYSGYYQKLGIGFIQIARNSFYWYIPALFSCMVILLIKLRKGLPPAYVTTGFLLLYCAIGNSIYFFGRSHEHNILNISIVLVFLFFLVLDLIMRAMGEAGSRHPVLLWVEKHGVIGMASVFIFLVIVSYSANITRRGVTQFQNLDKGEITYASFILPENFHSDLSKIREITDNSRKVLFLNLNDFAFYYYGGYAQTGYCNPLLTWIFTKDFIEYMQRRLNEGYFLVLTPRFYSLLGDFGAYPHTAADGFTVVGKQLNQRSKL